MAKTRCRRCRKATRVIHDSYKVCVRCMGELGRMEYDLRLIEERRRRIAQLVRDEWVG